MEKVADVDKLKNVNIYSELIVSGFIHKSQILLPSSNSLNFTIPDLVCSLCIKFYYIHEYWDILGTDVITSKDKFSLIKLKECNHFENTSYGFKQIPSKSNYVYTWDIKVNKLIKDNFIYIGIASTYKHTHNTFQVNRDDFNYVHLGNGYLSCNGKIAGMAETYKENDIISIQLDSTNGELMFFKHNDIEQNINIAAFNVKQQDDIKYKLAVSLYFGDMMITINTFKITNKT